MSKVEEYRQRLAQLKDWTPFLLKESGLPGPRGNLELAQAVARRATPQQIRAFLSIPAKTLRRTHLKSSSCSAESSPWASGLPPAITSYWSACDNTPPILAGASGRRSPWPAVGRRLRHAAASQGDEPLVQRKLVRKAGGCRSPRRAPSPGRSSHRGRRAGNPRSHHYFDGGRGRQPHRSL